MSGEDPAMDPLRGRADFKALVAEGMRKGPKAPPADSKKTEAAAVSRPAQLSAAAALRSPPWPRRIKQPPNTRSAWSCSTAAGSTMPPNTSGGHAPCVNNSSRANPRASSIRRTWPRRWRAWPGSTKRPAGPSQAARSWRESARLLTRVVAQRPDDRQAWKDLGIAHAELGERDDAATAFARLLELTPEFHRAAALIDLATLDRKAGRVEQSRRWWQKVLPIRARAVAQRPDDPKVWKDLGIVHAELGQPEAAATAFAKVMELTPQTKDEYSLVDRPIGPGSARCSPTYDEIFGRVVQMRPKDRDPAHRPLPLFRPPRRWREAADIVARIIELDPDDGPAPGLPSHPAVIHRRCRGLSSSDSRCPGSHPGISPERQWMVPYPGAVRIPAGRRDRPAHCRAPTET